MNEAARSTQTVVTFNLDRDRDRECSTSFASIETVPTMDSGLGKIKNLFKIKLPYILKFKTYITYSV